MQSAMINAIIVDDEPKNRRILKDLLNNYCPLVKVIDEASGSQDAISAIERAKPDLLFLDIEMPYGNAFDLLDKIKPIDFEIIFVTAFEEYTLKAFRYSALDYLLKPLNIEELKAAVEKASERLNLKTVNLQLNNLLFNLHKNSDVPARLAINSQTGLTFVSIIDIIRCEAKGNYTYIFTTDMQRHISSKNIKAYEDLLPANVFFRVHHSHLINIECVKKYHKGRGGIVEMTDGAMIEVATRRKNEFLALFGSR
jgi:two-component system LytT family response regulator